jgi:hypothetical protein
VDRRYPTNSTNRIIQIRTRSITSFASTWRLSPQDSNLLAKRKNEFVNCTALSTLCAHHLHTLQDAEVVK